jgi:hypothetical protein
MLVLSPPEELFASAAALLRDSDRKITAEHLTCNNRHNSTADTIRTATAESSAATATYHAGYFVPCGPAGVDLAQLVGSDSQQRLVVHIRLDVQHLQCKVSDKYKI